MDEGGKIRDGAKDTAELKLRPETHAAGHEERRPSDAPARAPARQLPAAHRRPRERSAGSSVRSCTTSRCRISARRTSRWAASCSPRRRPAASRRRIPIPTSRTFCPAHRPRSASFPSGDQLMLAVDVYDNKVATPHRVEIRTSLTADDGIRRLQLDRRASHRGVEGRQRHLRARRDDSPQGRRAGALRPARRRQVHGVERRPPRAIELRVR